jgi:hypothetical protein
MAQISAKDAFLDALFGTFFSFFFRNFKKKKIEIFFKKI